MPMEAYEYPAVLWCDRCNKDVEITLEDRTATYTHEEAEIPVPYKAAVCPICGKTLCERDRDFAFVAMTMKIDDEKPKERRNT